MTTRVRHQGNTSDKRRAGRGIKDTKRRETRAVDQGPCKGAGVVIGGSDRVCGPGQIDTIGARMWRVCRGSGGP